jgi:hypothetical protein
MNDDDLADIRAAWATVESLNIAQCHFAIREPSGEIRRCEPLEWLLWRNANSHGLTIVHGAESAGEYRVFVSFEGVSTRPDRPKDFWNCHGAALCGHHDGAVWSSRHSSESEAIEKARWLVEHFRGHGRFPDGPELHLSAHGILSEIDRILAQ